jgi:molybdate transport system ATP-binding protein
MSERTLEVDVTLKLGALALELTLATSSRRVSIAGPSGAGKSTTLRILAGLERRATGRVRVHEEAWLDTASRAFRPAWERGVGWVPQDSLLFPHLGVRENLTYAGASESAVREVAARLGIDALLDRRTRHLSGGERQRVAIARALLKKPRLLLLDEPFAALDPDRRESVVETVRELAGDNGTILVLASHDAAVTEALVEERWLLRDGRLSRVAGTGAPA